jgi:hypothetical protein
VKKPNATECSLPERDPTFLDDFCPNLDKCVEWAKKHLHEKCRSEDAKDRRVKFMIEYGMKIMYTNICLRDNKNEYCLVRKHDKSKCEECQPNLWRQS